MDALLSPEQYRPDESITMLILSIIGIIMVGGYAVRRIRDEGVTL